MDTKQRLEYAEQNYLAAVNTIRHLCKIRSSQNSFQKYYTNALWYFESALQGVLLYAGMEMGEMTASAKVFVRNCTMTGDILNTVNDIGARKLYRAWEKVSWDKIAPDNIDRNRYMEIVKEAIISSVRSCIFPLIETDADISSKSYSDEISGKVKNIIKAVFALDFSGCPDLSLDEKIEIAERSANAIEAGFNIFNDSFLLFWKGSVKLDSL